jgi:hypothetical protein
MSKGWLLYALLAAPMMVQASPVYLRCGKPGVDNSFSVTLDEGTGKAVHTTKEGLVLKGEAAFSEGTVNYSVTERIGSISLRTVVSISRLDLTGTVDQFVQGSANPLHSSVQCALAEPPTRRF